VITRATARAPIRSRQDRGFGRRQNRFDGRGVAGIRAARGRRVDRDRIGRASHISIVAGFGFRRGDDGCSGRGRSHLIGTGDRAGIRLRLQAAPLGEPQSTFNPEPERSDQAGRQYGHQNRGSTAIVVNEATNTP
jgi:hypothetical protein